jgi:hypothetical protein
MLYFSADIGEFFPRRFAHSINLLNYLNIGFQSWHTNLWRHRVAK